jgi:hypothetical protein
LYRASGPHGLLGHEHCHHSPLLQAPAQEAEGVALEVPAVVITRKGCVEAAELGR